jgi:hypothetical protein
MHDFFPVPLFPLSDMYVWVYVLHFKLCCRQFPFHYTAFTYLPLLLFPQQPPLLAFNLQHRRSSSKSARLGISQLRHPF